MFRSFQKLLIVCLAFLIFGVPGSLQAQTDYDRPGGRSSGDQPAPDADPPGGLPSGVPVALHRAESIQWNPERRLLTATGTVQLAWGPYKIQAERVQFFDRDRRLVAEGQVRAQTPQFDRMRAERIELIRPSDRIRVRSLEGRMPVPDDRGNRPPWFVNGARVRGQPDTLLRGRDFSFTTCNLETPHYDIQASTVYLYPNNVIVGYHATLHVGVVPVFYLPVFVVDLKDRLKRWIIRPGFSDEDGLELELGYHYLLPEDPGPLRLTLLTDIRENAGAGGGFDLGYRDDNGRAELFAFGARRNPTLVDETGNEIRSDTEQTIWRARSRVNYRLAEESPWSVQAFANWIENNRFDDDFRSSIGGRAQPTRSLDGSLIRQGENSLFRVDARREDRFNENVGSDGDFVTRREILPRVRHQLFSVPLDVFGLRLFYSSNNVAEKSLRTTGGRTLWDVAFENDLTKIVSLTPSHSQSYTVGYDQDFVEQTTPSGEEFRSIGSGRLRWRHFWSATDSLDLELDYRLEQRFNRRDQVPLNLNNRNLGTAEDGEVTHDLGLISRWQNDRVFAFLRTGYDLRDAVNRDIESDSRVISPILNFDVQLLPWWHWEQFVRYGWNRREVQQLNSTWRFNPTRDLTTSFDWNFTRTAGDNLSEFGSRFYWRSPADRWRLRGDVVWDAKRSDFEETRLMVYRSLHRWEARLYFRQIEDRENQVWLRFNLKGYPSQAAGLASELPELSPEFEQRGLQNLFE